MTIEEAKKIYIKYDCSRFAMAREEKAAYEEYKLLNISELIEAQWRQELFNILFEEVKKTGKVSTFNRLYNLAEQWHDEEKIIALKKALSYMKYKDFKSKVCICETIIGRKDILERSGMIFWAYDVGKRELAKELLRFVTDLLKSEDANEKMLTRIDRNIKKSKTIDDKLKLGMYDNI